MTQQLDVQVVAADGTSDCTVVLQDDHVTVAEVFAALDIVPDGARVNGRVIESPTTTAAVGVITAGGRVTSGDVAAVACRHSGEPSSGREQPTLEVTAVAGLDAGAFTALTSGLHQLSLDDAGRRWHVEVGSPQVQSAPWHIHGASVEAMATSAGALGLGQPVLDEPGLSRVVHRPPRRVPAEVTAPVQLPEPPLAVRPATKLSWITLLAPIPIALLMAFFFRPIFALFAAMGPVMAFGRWFESRRRFRRESHERSVAVLAMLASVGESVAAYLEAEARRRWVTQPHVGELWRRSRTWSVRLWERRPDSSGFLVAAVGVAPARVSIPTEGASPDAEVHGPALSTAMLRAVPHTVDLLAHDGVGLSGVRCDTLAVLRAIVLQLASLHGPADLRLGLLVTSSTAADWDWVKWLPHHDQTLTSSRVKGLASVLERPRSTGAVTRSRSSIAANSGAEPTGPIDVIIVDAGTVDVASLQRAAIQGGRSVRFLALGEHSTRLPAVCSALFHVTPVVAELATPELAGEIQRMIPVGVSLDTAVAWARAMASLVDPESVSTVSVSEDAVSLLSLLQLGQTRRGEAGHLVDQLQHQWKERSAADPLVASIGMAADAAFAIDLVADGPHALIAGTTGSGKSELLRTMVLALAASCPPDRLALVLVDFKGGGAFDAVDQLPHVAGLITDLEENLVSRAVSSLRAELHRREHLFRKLGVSDYAQAAAASAEPLARLVVVIDEFAVLATEYPELMTSLVDLAARGRSLGMHLVLATQRPSGVVDQKIRANTNLRIALRVQDAHDSLDVVGVPDAAEIDRTAPGRAIVSIGGDRPIVVQTAYSGAVNAYSTPCAVRPHQLFAEPEGPSRDAGTPELHQPGPGQTELQLLVAAVAEAGEVRGSTARPLWAEPLPKALDWFDLGSRLLASAADPASAESCDVAVAIGLVDLPEIQDQQPWRWQLSSGALGIYCADGRSSAKVLVATGAALASALDPTQLHLYVIDGDPTGMAALEALPHVGAYVTLTETDRVLRVVSLCEAELAERRANPRQSGPQLVLLIDNLAAILATLDELVASQLVDRIAALARDGVRNGIHVVIAARTVREMGHRLAQQIPNRLVMRLADPAAYLTLGLRSADVGPLPSMRAIDLVSQHVVQMVEPPDVASLVVGDSDLAADRLPRRVGSFPRSLARADLPSAHLADDGTILVPVGVEHQRLAPAAVVFRPGTHLLVASAAGMGRTKACHTLIHQLRDVGVNVVVIDPGRSECSGISAEQIAQLSSVDQRTVVVVDDAHLVSPELSSALEQLIADRPPLVSIVAGTTFDFARSMRSWVRDIRAAGSGLLLGGTAIDGDILRIKRPQGPGIGVLPGRGHAVDRGRIQLIQVAEPTGDP